jgi:hypothetical protein
VPQGVILQDTTLTLAAIEVPVRAGHILDDASSITTVLCNRSQLRTVLRPLPNLRRLSDRTFDREIPFCHSLIGPQSRKDQSQHAEKPNHDDAESPACCPDTVCWRGRDLFNGEFDLQGSQHHTHNAGYKNERGVIPGEVGLILGVRPMEVEFPRPNSKEELSRLSRSSPEVYGPETW